MMSGIFRPRLLVPAERPVVGYLAAVSLCLRWAAVAVAILSLATDSAYAQPGRHKDELSWDRKVGGLFQRYCYACHGREDPNAGINLAQDEHPGLILEHRDTWTTVLEVLQSRQMPPEDERQPDEHERQLMVDFLRETFQPVDCEQVRDPGKPVLRRLNRTEYDNTVFDLTGLNLRLAENFPPDPVAFGFDNIGEALALTPAQTEMYHAAARQIVDGLLQTRQQRPAIYQAVFGEVVSGSAPVPAPSADRVEDSASASAPPGLTAAQQANRLQAAVVMRRFAERAFRGPVDDYYLNRLLRIYDRGISQSEPHAVAVGHCLTAILISPRFLYRWEEDQPEATDAYPVSQFELASRLSYFLWSRPPDEQLLQAARQQRLHAPDELQTQVQRMLADSRSRALVDNFFAQWLDFRRLDEHQPDPDVFPEFDPSLRRAMRDEVNLLFLEMIAEDLPVTQLIDSDHIYANSRLAAHYGLPPVAGDLPVKVALPDRRRGGLLSSAAWLMLQSDPGRTNIPRRGNFIAGQLLGSPPPPPPPGVPPLEASQDGQQRSLREVFELHRRSPECRSCHAKIDPLGFSLENYDGLGRWRETDEGVPIDASAELDGSSRFTGIVGLKEHLLERKEIIVRQLSNRLLVYALGRGLEASDQCVIEQMVAAAQRHGDKFSALVSALVTSVPFTHRRNPEY